MGKRSLLTAAALLCIMCALLSACSSPAGLVQATATASPETATASPGPVATPTLEPTPMPTPTPLPAPQPTAQSAEIGFVGDIMMMPALIRGAQNGDGYDFSDSFRYIDNLFLGMDLMCGNFEGTLSGEEAGYSLPRLPMATPSASNPSPTKPPLRALQRARRACARPCRGGLRRALHREQSQHG